MRHPFASWSESSRKRAFGPILALALGVLAIMRVLDAPLQTSVAPLGIVSLELAGELEVAHDMIGSWGHRGELYAALGLGLDYLFIVLYSSALALACVLVAGRLAPRAAARAGAWLAWGQYAAAVLDGIETYSLIRLLLGSAGEVWPPLAKWSALGKFALIGAGLAYVVIGAIAAATLRGRPHQSG